mmetsp:Transcript_22256/g.87659  ORF Transcript_22256/g.87659 Transcript_22256/m.87659 type:complete len:380 (-) Transcript_22256:900-2039(-)
MKALPVLPRVRQGTGVGVYDHCVEGSAADVGRAVAAGQEEDIRLHGGEECESLCLSRGESAGRSEGDPHDSGEAHVGDEAGGTALWRGEAPARARVHTHGPETRGGRAAGSERAVVLLESSGERGRGPEEEVEGTAKPEGELWLGHFARNGCPPPPRHLHTAVTERLADEPEGGFVHALVARRVPGHNLCTGEGRPRRCSAPGHVLLLQACEHGGGLLVEEEGAVLGDGRGKGGGEGGEEGGEVAAGRRLHQQEPALVAARQLCSVEAAVGAHPVAAVGWRREAAADRHKKVLARLWQRQRRRAGDELLLWRRGEAEVVQQRPLVGGARVGKVVAQVVHLLLRGIRLPAEGGLHRHGSEHAVDGQVEVGRNHAHPRLWL